MNTLKIGVIAAVVALAAVAVLGVGLAVAQVPTSWGYMGGMMGSGSMTLAPARSAGVGGDDGSMQAMHAWMSRTGGMHTVVWDALAETLSLTPEALQAELADGQTLAEVAEAQGVDQGELATALEAAMQTELDKAVADGALTQAQADQMLTAMVGRYAWMIEHMASGQMGAGMTLAPARGAGVGSGFEGGCHNIVSPQTNG